jgi:pyruvate dehydrogenase (quinone)
MEPRMAKTVSDFVLDRLRQWGVKRVFGYPGDGINGLLSALGRLDLSEIDFIQVRHEEEAAFMACGHAKFTGEVGVCMTTSGPGAIHLLNGLYDATSIASRSWRLSASRYARPLAAVTSRRSTLPP